MPAGAQEERDGRRWARGCVCSPFLPRPTDFAQQEGRRSEHSRGSEHGILGARYDLFHIRTLMRECLEC
ncbi:hypothetical protein E2C01_024105 [Portunus trituberculatus]|uniref:Uncharacterized protein n=1 Tax=Portunus trituberculatus TaxID=210409 RepID=A0A5B7ECA0_PORTR|nr:hypothetical protein [Portunus trituberculatus]